MKNNNDNENSDREKLKYFAEKAKEVMTLNINYHKQKDIYEKYIKEIKKILFDKDKLQDNIRKINNQLKSNISNLQQEYTKIKSYKYDNYYKICTDEFEMGKPLLNQLKDDKFTLEHTLSQKSDIIKVLSLNMKNSIIFSLFRPPKRDTLLDLKEGNSAIDEIIVKIQSNLLTNSKNFNALKEKIKKNKIKIGELKDKIRQINEYINMMQIEKLKIEQKNKNKKDLLIIPDFSKKLISNQKNCLSNLKTSDRTCSTCEATSNIKDTENKENININIIKNSNNKFELSKSIGKKYEEDKNNNLKSNDFDENKKDEHIIKAIMSTIIPDKVNFRRNNRININPTKTNCETFKNDIEITSTKFSEEIKINNNTNSKALSAENRTSKKKNKNKNYLTNAKIIESFQNLEELFQSTDSDNEKEEIIIDNVIHSDDDTTLEKKIIQNKNIQNAYISKIHSTVPKINLDLIEFNKLKAYQEVDLYSLERRDHKNLSLDDNINMTKKKLKKLKNKININSKKVVAMKKYIDDLKNKYILFKKIKTNSSAFNSKVNYIANHEIIDLNKVEEDEDENENDIGSDYLNENEEITE